MASLTDPASAWTEEHLALLVDQGEPEGQRLEYKRELRLATQADRIEAAKDLSALSNADGGRLIFGVAEEKTDDGDRVPTRISALTDGALPDRLRDTISGICQPIPHYTPRCVDVAGGYCLVLEVPIAPAPIMITVGDKENRFYRRYNNQVLAMGEREVREAYARFEASRAASERLVQEADPMGDLPIGEQQIFVESGWTRPPVWYSVIAVPTLAPAMLFDPAKLSGFDLATEDAFWTGGLLRPTAFGLEATWGSHVLALGRVRLHRNGVLRYASLPTAQQEYLVRRERSPLSTVWAAQEVPRLAKWFALAARLYREVGYFGPLVVRSEIRHLGGMDLVERDNDVAGTIVGDDASFESRTNTDELVATRYEHLQALFDRIAQASGRPRSEAVQEAMN